ncbi:MAG: RNA polymerase sigma-70 factor [Mariniphaga sp.]
MKTEKEIIEELRGGVASAFDHLYGAYSRKLYYFSLSILKSNEDAAEVVQNTYLKIWEKRKSIDSSHSFKSFLFTVAYHIAIDLLRERLNERKYRENILTKASSNYNLEEALGFGDLLKHVEHIVNQLPPRKHEIYHLSRIDHLSYNEIAGQLNISVKTVENSLNYTMNFIKARLGKDSLVFLLYTFFFI